MNDLYSSGSGATLNAAALNRIHQFETSMDQLKDEYRALFAIYNEGARHMENLQRDLAVFKNAYDEAKYEKKMISDKLAEMQKYMATQTQIICLIDGDGFIFVPELLAQGQHGGRAAARMLSESTRMHLNAAETEPLDLWVYIFCNKKGLVDTLGKVGLQDAKMHFDDFVVGFNQAGEKFLMVDVGSGKEAADAKIKMYLDVHGRSLQTRKIFFGGSHDNGYGTKLRSMMTDGLHDKLVLLLGYKEMAREIRDLMLPTLEIPNLFITEKLVATSSIKSSPNLSYAQASVHSPPLSPSPNRGSSWREAAAASPTKATAVSRPTAKSRHLDSSVPFWKQQPPPCTLFYLLECKHTDCKYGHDYILTEDDYQTLKDNAKRTPCSMINSNNACAFGDSCLYGHVCPQGPFCSYRKLGRCKFIGDGMHAD